MKSSHMHCHDLLQGTKNKHTDVTANFRLDSARRLKSHLVKKRLKSTFFSVPTFPSPLTPNIYFCVLISLVQWKALLPS